MGIAGIPWWTTDIGGFFGANIYDESYHEVFVRWFEYGAFCPVMRLHGYRMPYQHSLARPVAQSAYPVHRMRSGRTAIRYTRSAKSTSRFERRCVHIQES